MLLLFWPFICMLYIAGTSQLSITYICFWKLVVYERYTLRWWLYECLMLLNVSEPGCVYSTVRNMTVIISFSTFILVKSFYNKNGITLSAVLYSWHCENSDSYFSEKWNESRFSKDHYFWTRLHILETTYTIHEITLLRCIAVYIIMARQRSVSLFYIFIYI